MRKKTFIKRKIPTTGNFLFPLTNFEFATKTVDENLNKNAYKFETVWRHLFHSNLLYISINCFQTRQYKRRN